VLAAARRAGVRDIFRIGGAQAVAALAYGTESVAAVDKIVGPGNAWVAAAKREVFGQVGIDSIAGPSEILVIADAANNPDWIAADLLAQAEHDASSQSILITDDAGFADKVADAAERALALLPRRDIASRSWDDYGGIIVVEKLTDAPALAYGTAAIAPVDKIVGPGNAWVAAAKREVFGQVGIDSIAGPSEILVIADAANNPDWIAADLLSQAEHDASSQSILITDNAGFADKVADAAERALALLPRKAIAARSWGDYGGIIVVEKLTDAPALADRFAPEHLEIATADPNALLAKVRHAGAIFLGRHTPEAMGDYIAGPNHVLPTSRSARFSSGLSVLDFMKRTTLLSLDAGAMAVLGPPAIALAEAEGLEAHARSIAARLNRER
jgi:histidinol dehydrogenase